MCGIFEVCFWKHVVAHTNDVQNYVSLTKVLRGALQRKFPSTSDKDLLKIVGNLIYYRYINSAIAAPDAFELVANRYVTTRQWFGNLEFE